jgi:hypothetical protein
MTQNFTKLTALQGHVLKIHTDLFSDPSRNAENTGRKPFQATNTGCQRTSSQFNAFSIAFSKDVLY